MEEADADPHEAAAAPGLPGLEGANLRGEGKSEIGGRREGAPEKTFFVSDKGSEEEVKSRAQKRTVVRLEKPGAERERFSWRFSWGIAKALHRRALGGGEGNRHRTVGALGGRGVAHVLQRFCQAIEGEEGAGRAAPDREAVLPEALKDLSLPVSVDPRPVAMGDPLLVDSPSVPAYVGPAAEQGSRPWVVTPLSRSSRGGAPCVPQEWAAVAKGARVDVETQWLQHQPLH